MNPAKIYGDAVGRTEAYQRRVGELDVKTGVSPTEEATLKQQKFDWLQSSVTTVMFKQIGEQIEALRNQATELATTYHQHNNHQQIINLLIQANTLKKQLEAYAKT